jgi:hypothetical protein
MREIDPSLSKERYSSLILAKWKCTEKEVYAAFCEKNSTKDETEMVRLEGAFKAAMMDFTSKYGDKLVCIPKWKIAESPV